MLNERIFLKMNAAVTMDVVQELRSMGLIQGYDFEFKYNPATYNNDGWQELQPQGTEFHFREGKWRTYLTLKYAD